MMINRVSHILIYLLIEITQGHLKEYRKTFEGSHDSHVATGHFTSPRFPKKYPLDNTIHTFIIHNTSPDGFIQVTFDDLDLHPKSLIEVYENPSNKRMVGQVNGDSSYNERKAFASRGKYLRLVFRSGCCGGKKEWFQGFKAQYKFVSYPPNAWLEKPTSDCGEWERDGGFVKLYNPVMASKYYDCVWVLPAPAGTEAYVMVETFWHNRNRGAKSHVEVRSGLTSEGTLVGTVSDRGTFQQQKESHGFTSPKGLYIRLRGKFRYSSTVTLSYGTYVRSKVGCKLVPEHVSLYNYYCQRTHRCIKNNLLCDGHDHCGDGQDEVKVDGECKAQELNIVPTAVSPSETTCPQLMKRCPDGKCIYDLPFSKCRCEHATDFRCDNNKCISQDLECNGKDDCGDMSDELFCGVSTANVYGETYFQQMRTAVIVTAVIFALIIMVITIIVCVRNPRNCVTKKCTREPVELCQDEENVQLNSMPAPGCEAPEAQPSCSHSEPVPTLSVEPSPRGQFISNGEILPLEPPPYNEVVEAPPLLPQPDKPEPQIIASLPCLITGTISPPPPYTGDEETTINQPGQSTPRIIMSES
ncbi:uncharacterized protein LOC141901144 [Tubulanus polymorphus]|uniref:uncharacterized protein LOC141901144 n=1 Tax=Tubulanus polymorphus TaxID=672921 RepID=UPI003DA679B1